MEKRAPTIIKGDLKVTPAIRYLKSQKIPYTLYEYECGVTHGFGEHSAQMLGRSQSEVYKTLVFHQDKTYAVAVVPVNCTLNLKSAAKFAGFKKAEMADPVDAERLTGYVCGGISPLGQKKRFKTVIDEEALKHPEILVSGGKRGLSVGLDPNALVSTLGASVGHITDSL